MYYAIQNRIIFHARGCTNQKKVVILHRISINSTIMEEKVFIATAMFGLQTRLQFNCSAPVVMDGVFQTITEVDANGCIVNNGGIITIDTKMQRAGISYGPLSIALDVIITKEADGNYHFKCATDLCRVDLFICEQNVWKNEGEAIFY